MLIIDGHLDLAWNALQWNRDLTLDAHTIRVRESRMSGPGRGRGMVSLPDLKRGHIAVCFATMLARSTGCPVPHLDFASPTQCYGIAQGQLAYYRALERNGILRFITNTATLDHHMAEWRKWESAFASDRESPPVGVVLSMEGADPILDPEDLAEWWQAGLRILSLVHYGVGHYAGGTGTNAGITPPGKRLLDGMEHLGILLDLSHLSDRAFWEAMEQYQGPVLASHNNCRALVPHQRQFTDRQLRAIFERDGVVGVAFDAWMLVPGWVIGQSQNDHLTLTAVADHIDHICQLAGNSRHAAIGSDLDGGFGQEQAPHDLDTIADMQMLGDLLARRGYSGEDIAAIMYGNWLRLLRENWRSRDRSNVMQGKA